jgi:hypothetical protein
VTVFVLGAGATRGASFVQPDRDPCLPPLDADFFLQLQRIQNPKHAGTIDQTLRDLHRMFGRSHGITLETAFSTVETTIRMVHTADETTDFALEQLWGMRSNLLQAVAAVLEESLTETHDGHGTLVMACCDYHTWLVEQMHAGDTTISYNYDCLIDHALRTSGEGKWNAYYGYGFGDLAEQDKLDQHPFWSPDDNVAGVDETVYLLKLHGSLNFQRTEGDGIKLKARPYTRQHGDLKFEIIPPESHKNFDESFFQPLWRHASRAINTTESMVLIGYSFPPTDLHSVALFRSSVAAGALKKLTIVNPDREARARTVDVLRRGIGEVTRIIEFDCLREFAETPRALWG